MKGEDNLQFNGQAPFFGFVDLFTFASLTTNPTAPLNYLSQPFVATGQPNPFPSRPPASNIDFGAAGFLPIGGGGVFFVDPHLRTPYIYQYNLSIQHELIPNLTLETNYVGSSSHKLTDLVDANPFVLGTLRRLFNTQPGTNNFSYSFLDEFRNVANAHYNSLELSLTKRLSSTRSFGTTFFTFAYTYGHSIMPPGSASATQECPSTTPDSLWPPRTMTFVTVSVSAGDGTCHLTKRGPQDQSGSRGAGASIRLSPTAPAFPWT